MPSRCLQSWWQQYKAMPEQHGNAAQIPPATDREIATLKMLEAKILWLASWTIHHANHVREKDDELKVGGHQASSASMATIMTALYFHALRPQDRIAVKPHASPIFHAIQYLAGNQTREKLENFRGFGGAQSYPSRTKDIDDVDFSTGSVGLGVAITAFASIVQQYIKAKDWAGDFAAGRMVALVGDAELDEGNIYECLQEGWKHGLKNTWWIVDYNRQSLDGVVHEGLNTRLEKVFEAFGWNIVRLKYGKRLQSAFDRPGGEALRDWIDRCPNEDFSALTFQGGAAWRGRLLDEIGDQGDVSALVESFDDDALQDLMTDLGGHCMGSLTDAFSEASRTDRPTVFFAYTVKGHATPLAGHKDNHAGLMNGAQMAAFAQKMGVGQGEEWSRVAGTEMGEAQLDEILSGIRFFSESERQHSAPALDVPDPVPLDDRRISTQAAFGKLLDGYAKTGGAFADHIVTTSPDVTVSTNLGAWVNRRGLFAEEDRPDHFKSRKIPSTQKWQFSPDGQHIELGIAEMNLFILLAAAGLSEPLFGRRLLPVGTLYDPFISRGLDALNYGCYQDSRFLLVATPAGITLAPEGGAHQSIGTPLIGMSQPGLMSFEPAFADELGIILKWAFEYMQAPKGEGGSVYLRLTTRQLDQPERNLTDMQRRDLLNGAYWLRRPSGNTDIVIAYQGCVAPEAIEATGRIGEDRRDVALLSVTSLDRLYADWSECRRNGSRNSHAEQLLGGLPPHCTIVTAIDGYPSSLAWLGGVAGHRCISLGVEAFGQTGSIPELYAHYGISADAIVRAANQTEGRPIRHLRSVAC